jgi:acetylornithine deacetylase
MEKVSEICMNEPRFMDLLGKLIGESKFLQNNPAQGLVPKEDLACGHVMNTLAPYSKENGGPLEIQKIAFVEGRGNLIIKYPGTGGKVK